MNNNEKNECASTPAPPRDESTLLQEMMPQLGMEATQPKRRYKRKAFVRYAVRLGLILGVILLIGALAWLYLTTPAKFYNVQTTESVEKVTVAFQVDHTPVLDSVTAQLDGRLLPVERLDPGSYTVETDRNGQLVLTATTLGGKESSTSIAVTAIDDESPHLGKHERDGDKITIWITDGENGSGVDWDTLHVTLADGSGDYPVDGADEQEGCFTLTYPEQPVRIQVRDGNGNAMSALLSPTSGSEEE